MSSNKIFSLLTLLGAILGMTSTSAAAFTPYSTTISVGDIDTAQILFGSDAAVGMPGRDAIPAFTDIEAYDTYYEMADDQSCDLECVAPTFHRLRNDGRLRPLLVGKSVRVLNLVPDPEDARYKACRIRYSIDGVSHTGIVVCVALRDQPE